MRRWVGVFLAAACAVVALGSSAPAAAADESSDSFEEALTTWHPVDLEASAPASSLADFDADALAGCASGAYRDWTPEAGGSIRLFWIDCESADAAIERVRAEWSDFAYLLPAPGVAPALDEGVELIGRFTNDSGDPMLYRMWAQGDHFIGVGRACGHGDAACEQANAADAQSISALSTAAVGALSPPERLADDPLRDFVPADDGTWVLRYSLPADTTIEGVDARCHDGIATAFVDVLGDAVKVFWVDCPTLARAQELVVDYWSAMDRSGLAPLYGADRDGVARSGAEGDTTIYRWWIQGTRYVQVEHSCADDDETRCADRTAEYEQTIVGMLRDEMQPLTDWGKALWALVVLLGVPIATYLVLLVPRNIVARRRQRETDPVWEPDATAQQLSVDTIVRTVRVGRIARRIVLLVVGTLASLVVMLSALFSNQLAIQVIGLFLSPFLVFFAVGALLDLVWKPNMLVRPPRRRGRPTARGFAGALLRGLAVGIAVASLALYVLLVLFMWFNGLQTEAAFRAQIEQSLADAEGAARLFPLTSVWLQDLQHTGWIVVLFFAMVAVPIFLAYLLDRVGKRLARRSLHETLAQDDRPYFLYLRGFDEDQLRIDESLGRRGFLEVLSPFGRPRFEEVLAEHLSAWGPVIAISGAKRRLQDLGAVKISLGGEFWKEQVQEWMGGARAVVLSATPSEVRAGLEWEIAQLASRPDAPPVILVISPWPRAERDRRWRGFLDSAGRWALFRALIERPAPSATSILTYNAVRGWTAYASTRRWDWSYAASLRAAILRGDLERAPHASEASETPETPEMPTATEAQRQPEPA